MHSASFLEKKNLYFLVFIFIVVIQNFCFMFDQDEIFQIIVYVGSKSQAIFDLSIESPLLQTDLNPNTQLSYLEKKNTIY